MFLVGLGFIQSLFAVDLGCRFSVYLGVVYGLFRVGLGSIKGWFKVCLNFKVCSEVVEIY